MKKLYKIFLGVLVVACISAAVHNADATSVKKMTVADLISNGDKIIAGRVTAVTDGSPGTEFIIHYRFWYELPLFDRMGIGVAPILVQRTSHAQNADPRVLNVSTVMGELYLYGAF